MKMRWAGLVKIIATVNVIPRLVLFNDLTMWNMRESPLEHCSYGRLQAKGCILKHRVAGSRVGQSSRWCFCARSRQGQGRFVIETDII